MPRNENRILVLDIAAKSTATDSGASRYGLPLVPANESVLLGSLPAFHTIPFGLIAYWVGLRGHAAALATATVTSGDKLIGRRVYRWSGRVVVGT